MRERDIERYLVKRVKELGGEVRKVQWIGRRGAPDRVVLRNGTRVAVARLQHAGLMLPTVKLIEIAEAIVGDYIVWPEIKAPGKKPEPHQIREHLRMRLMGQSVVVVDSIERVDEVLA